MNKILGISFLLVAVFLFTAIRNPNFVSPFNLQNLIQWSALYGIIGIGVAFVIITGGIDLSIGSVIGLTGCLLPMLLTVTHVDSEDGFTVEQVKGREIVVKGDASDIRNGDMLKFETQDDETPSLLRVQSISVDGERSVFLVARTPKLLKSGMRITISYMEHMNVALAIGLILLLSLAIGLTHGLLVAKLKLQPFVVTLCGLLIYRGIARWITGDEQQGFGSYHEGLMQLAKAKIPIPFVEGFMVPLPFLMLVGLAILAAVFLNKTIYGRYLLALGRNEQAARYSGINTDRMVILAYVICSVIAGLAGILFALDAKSIHPVAHGNFFELYAIAAAVLGGCSLRGGEGSIFGVVIGAALIRVLYNSINMLRYSQQLIPVILGLVILMGVIIDELVKRLAAKRRAIQRTKGT